MIDRKLKASVFIYIHIYVHSVFYYKIDDG